MGISQLTSSPCFLKPVFIRTLTNVLLNVLKLALCVSAVDYPIIRLTHVNKVRSQSAYAILSNVSDGLLKHNAKEEDSEDVVEHKQYMRDGEAAKFQRSWVSASATLDFPPYQLSNDKLQDTVLW